MDIGRWSKREQLYLVSAVSAAGEQADWNAVSRSMKQWLGGGKPPDCFSPKHCAAQHKALLQQAGRHPAGGQANEALLQRLIAERMDELKSEILNNQLMYAEIHSKMVYAQTDDCSEEELSAMLKEIEQHPAFDGQRIEELKRAAERAEPKAEWRPTPVLTDNTTAVDMDVEEIIGTKQIIMPASAAGQQTLGGPSPLLSSLLKTPNATPVAPVVQQAASSTTNSSQGRPTAAAPTITTLLTSGAVSNQPVLTLKSTSPAEAVYLLNRPISGPPVDSLLAASTPAQTLLSPSQSAPTLSMLLEKNKVVATEGDKSLVSAAAAPQQQIERGKQQIPAVSVESMTETPSLGGSLVGAAVEAEPEPEAMAIDDVEAAAELAANASGGTEVDEDASEEQQLLEVFKNIGDIEEELAAVIGEDFLKDVDDETAHDSPASVKTDKDEAPPSKAKADEAEEKPEEEQKVAEDPEKEEGEKASSESQEEEAKEEVLTSERESPTPDEEESQESANGSDSQPLKKKQDPADVKPTTQVFSSSEDDDIPLAAVASGKLEAKNKQQNEAKVDEGDEDKASMEDLEKKEDSTETHEAPFKEPLKQDSKTDSQLKDSTEDEAMPFIVLDEEDEEATGQEPEEEEAKVETTEEAETKVDEGKQRDKKDVEHQETKEEKASPEDEGHPPEAKAVDSDPLAVEADTAAAPDMGDERETENADGGEADIEPIEVEEDDEDNGGGELPPPPVPAASTTADTDYDSSATDASVPTSRRDDGGRSSSRRSNRHKTPVDEDSQNSSINSAATIPITPTSSTQSQQSHQQQQQAPSGRTVPLHLRRLRDRERSESPLIEPDADAAPHQRLRRLRSSTPINDSVPNSPASMSDDVAADRDQRNSKKSLLSIYNALQPQKYAALFQRPEEGTSERRRYDRLVLRPMDWATIKKHIEAGSIRSVAELQRDILLMCTNAMMVFHTNSSDYRAVRAFLLETQSIREFTANPLVDGAGGSSSKPERDSRRRTPTPAATTTAKRGGRKSQRNT